MKKKGNKRVKKRKEIHSNNLNTLDKCLIRIITKVSRLITQCGSRWYLLYMVTQIPEKEGVISVS